MNFSDIMAEAVLSIEKSCLVAHDFKRSFEKIKKRNHQMQRALFYVKHTDKFTSPKHNLLVFQVRINKAQD